MNLVTKQLTVRHELPEQILSDTKHGTVCVNVRLCLVCSSLSLAQALCFTHRVPVQRIAAVAPVRGHFGRSGGLVSSESLALYESVSITGN